MINRHVLFIYSAMESRRKRVNLKYRHAIVKRWYQPEICYTNDYDDKIDEIDEDDEIYNRSNIYQYTLGYSEFRRRKRISLRNRNSVMQTYYYPSYVIQHFCCIGEREIYNEENIVEQCTQKYVQNYNERTSIHILNDDCLRHIFQFLPISDRIRIERVCKHWRNVSLDSWYTMRTLDLSYTKWGGIDEDTIFEGVLREVLLRCGIFLRKLDLSNMEYISAYYNCRNPLSTIAYLCRNITDVNLKAIAFNRSDIDALAKNCKNIIKFTMGTTEWNIEDGLSEFLKISKNLKYFELYHNSLITGSCLSFLPENLRTLIVHCQVKMTGSYLFKAFERLRYLEKLVINGCFHLQECALEKINQFCPNLKFLHYGVRPEERIVCVTPHFTNLRKLENISFHNCFQRISENTYNDMVLHCRELIDIDIKWCRNVTDVELQKIARLPKLEKLSIPYTQATRQSLHYIQNLKTFKCRGSDITIEEVMMILASSPQLEVLDISNCNIINEHLFEVVQKIKEICNTRPSKVLLKMIVKIARYPDKNNTCLHVEESPCKFLQVIDEYPIYPGFSLVFGPCPLCAPNEVNSYIAKISESWTNYVAYMVNPYNFRYAYICNKERAYILKC